MTFYRLLPCLSLALLLPLGQVRGASYPDTVTNDNPVAYWRLGEAFGSSNAVDSVGSFTMNVQADVVLGQPGANAGDTDTSAGFPGTPDSFLNRDDWDPELNPTEFSVEFLARPSGGSGTRAAVGSSDYFLADEIYGYEVGLGTGDVWQFRTGRGFVFEEDAWNILTGSTAALGAWAHVVATFDGTNMHLYVDGVSDGALTNVMFTEQTFWESRIGAGANEMSPPDDLWIGDLDEVSIYDYALSSTQVQNHYATLSFDVPETVVLDIGLAGGLVEVSWTTANTGAVLQGSADLLAPPAWTNIPGASSPYTNASSDSIKSFRLVE